MTGNSGVGKSRSMAYFLRILMQRNKTFVYDARKGDFISLFVPSEGKYSVFSCESRLFFPGSCVHLQNANNYYLIDPMYPEKIVNVAAHTVLCASPNQDHFKEFQKIPNTSKWFIPVWKEDELKALQYEIQVDERFLTDEEFKNRFSQFGGRIRFIYSNSMDYMNWCRLLLNSLASVELKTLEKIFYGDSIEESHNNPLPSMLFVLDLKDECQTNKYLIGSNDTIKIGSRDVKILLARYYWKKMMNHLDPRNSSISGTTKGKFFEIVASTYLEMGSEFSVFNEEKKLVQILNIPSSDRIEKSGSWKDYLTFCSTLKENATPRQYVEPSSTNQPVIFAMDSHRRGYQITVGKTHGINRKRFQEMIEILKLSSKNPLEMYFVILQRNLENFQWNFDSRTFSNLSDGELKKCLNIHYICVPNEPDTAALSKFIDTFSLKY
jgi:hypothetical protein